MRGRSGGWAFVALLAVAAVTELAGAWLAYHTLGAVTSSVLFLAVGLNLVPIILHAARKPSLAVLAALALFVVIVPYQGLLGHRLLALQDEAGKAVSYVYGVRLRTGEYPADLSGYSFNDPGLRPFFQEYRRDPELGGFGLYWYVGTPGTSHSYTPRQGWSYYPD